MSKPSDLFFHDGENDAIKGKRIIVEARKFSKPAVISGKTSQHGAQRIKADQAEAWVERAYVAGVNL